MIYLPKSKVGVVVFSNIENELCPILARDIALIAVSKPYEPFRFHRTVLSAAQLQEITGDFLFGADFYRANATLILATEGSDLILKWPGGPDAPLLPIDTNVFMDRYYWTRATLTHGKNGAPDELHYGDFVGKRLPAQKH